MPDQNLPSSISGRHLGPDEIANHAFPNARKGLDPEAVRRFLAEVAAQVRDLRNERNELRVTAAAPRPAPVPEPQPQQQPLDEATLTKVLGEETTRVLQTARESAGAIVSKAEGQAAELIAGAEAHAQSRRQDADSAVLAMTERAKNEAVILIDKTKSECRQMIEEAREARRRILADLSDRRRVLLVQLEQIRVGKESMIAVVESVASNVVKSIDAVRKQLTGAEEGANLAAEHVTGDLDAAVESGEDIDAIVAEALAKLPRSGEEAVFTSFEGRESPVEEVKVFDIERERNPRQVIQIGGSAVASSEVTATGPISSGERDSVGGLHRIPDRTQTVGADQRAGLVGSDEVLSAQVASPKDDVEPVDSEAVDKTPDDGDTAPVDIGDVESEDVESEDVDTAPVDTEDVETAAGSSGDVDATAPGTTSKDASPVDQLFARIRASRESRVADAQRVLSDSDDVSEGRASQGRRRAKANETVDATSPAAAHGDQEPADNADDRAEQVADIVADEVAATDADIADVTDSETTDGETTTNRSSMDASKQAARDALLQPAHAELARAMKRAFREEQNLLLDGLRNRKKTDALVSLLPGEATRVRLIEAALPGVGVAYIAGEEFLSSGPHKNRRSSSENDAIAEISGRLAQEVLDALYARLLPAFSEEKGQEIDVVETVGTVFRDWKAARVESLALDYAIDAFGAGTVAYASTKKLALVWNFDDGGSGCPDCDDNGVAGAVVAGKSFPTGHEHPPVHPGCRCFLSS